MSNDVQVRLRLPKELADRILLLPSPARAEVVAAGLDKPAASASILVPGWEREAVRVAIGMFRQGASQGGKIGFRAEQECLHQYGDIADDLASLLAKLGDLP